MTNRPIASSQNEERERSERPDTPERAADPRDGRGAGDRWWVQIGAEAAAVPSLAEARLRGFDTLVFDPDSRAPGAEHATRQMTRAACDLDSIRADVLAVARTGRVCGVSTSSNTAAALRAAATIRSEYDLRGPGIECSDAILTRSRWKKTLGDLGIATPVSAILDSPAELDRFLGVHPSALLSPASGRIGSVGVARVRMGDPRSRELFDEARHRSTSELVRAEAFVAGEEYGIDACVRGGEITILHLGRQFSMRHLRGTLPTGTAWGTARSGERAGDDLDFRRFAEPLHRIAPALGIEDGYVSLDLIDDGDTLHVIEIRPCLGEAIDRALVFAGVAIGALTCDLALGETRARVESWEQEHRAFAQRFFYGSAAGRLRHASAIRAAHPGEFLGWRTLSMDRTRMQIVWDQFEGEPVERPRSRKDRIASVLVEAENRNAAWMRVNEIDPDSLFVIEEEKPSMRTASRPSWPMAPPPA